MKKHTKKLLAILLSVMMVFTVLIPAASAAAVGKGGKTLEMIPVDPSRLNVPKLGDVADADDASSEDLPYGLNDTVRVSIFLAEPSALDAGYAMQGVSANKAAVDYQAALRRNQATVQSKIEAAIGSALDVKWNLTLLTNAISANVRYGDLDAIRAIPDVKSVELERQYSPMETTDSDAASPNMTNARDMVGANSGNATKYKGAGSILAVIDTGLDTAHQSFNAEAFDYAIAEDEAENGVTYDLLTSAEVSAIKSQLNGRNGIYISSKIPFAYNYVDNNTTVNHESDTQEEHGSHVAGITSANRYLKSGNSYVSAAETVKVVGEAPDAQIMVMKVFGSGGGAYDSDYFAAVEDAVRLGASSCNLSLGSSLPGIATETTASYLTILNNLESTGLVMSVSMGNNTSWDSQKQLYADDVNLMTGGSPGSFNNTFTVASIDDTGAFAPYLLFNDTLELRYLEGGGSANNAPMTTVAGEYNYVYVDGVGTAAQFNAVASELRGAIALCNRGETSFYEKANAAVAAGAVATIIVNNQAGTISMALDGYSYTNPCVSIKQAEGVQIKSISTQKTASGVTYYTGTIKIGGADDLTRMAFYDMSSFSSWGPTGALTLKPEITAPGGSVLSLNGYHRNATGSGYSGGHDQYELMSGTSMAAPQITGLVAAVGQYFRDNDIANRTGLTARQFAQSMLMSTSIPVMEGDSNYYYSLLKQGSGLANLEGVVDAKSYIKMGADASMTASDYKVKAELGDDPARTGVYTYSFEIHNFSDTDVAYNLRTDVFTQALSADKTLMEHITAPLDAVVSYVWDDVVPDVFAADVNKDGFTDALDADAILAYVSGENDGSAYDLTVAELDGADGISSRDAYALLAKLAEEPAVIDEDTVVKAGEFRTVTVTIRLTAAQKAILDAERKGGAYLEAFTFIESDDDVTYSIPVLGFYGSWTDASMFDAPYYAEDTYYESGQTSYYNASNTNQVLIRYNGSTTNTAFIGNPYVKEDKFPADRLALNSNANIYQIRYGLIRPAAGVAFAAVDENGSVLYAANPGSNQNAAYYNTQASTPSWQNTSVSSTTTNRTVSSLGVAENAKFTFGIFAFPEYYTYQANGHNRTFALTSAQFQKILRDGNFGRGAYVGYTVAVDNTAPVIEGTVLNDDGTVTLTVSENQYIANIRIMDVSGRNTYLSFVPEQNAAGGTVSYTFDPADYTSANAVTVFAADYAGNETASIVRVGEGPIVIERAIYKLTNTLEAGKNYLIVNANTAGTRYALSHTNATKGRATVTVANVNGVMTIEEVDANAVFTAAANGSGVLLNNGSYYLAATRNNVTFSTTKPGTNYYFTFNGTNNRLGYYSNGTTYYVRYSNNAFTGSTSNYSVYLFVEETVTENIDPYAVSTVNVTPATLALYSDATANLNVEVLPVTATDKTVTWSSSNDAVATVDQSGKVTAVGGGNATITATSNSDNTVSGSCTVTVTARTAMNATVNAQLTADGSNTFVKIDLADLSTEILGSSAATYYGGGRSEDYIVGFTSSTQGEVVVTVIEDGSYSSAVLGTFGTNTYNMLDGSHVPTLSATVDGETLSEHYHSFYCASSYLLLMDADVGSITGWNASGYRALAYAGTDVETGAHYYWAMNNSGQVLPMMISIDEEEPITTNEETGEKSLTLTLGTGTATSISGLSFSANNMSMTYIDDGNYVGLLIANNNNKCIYFVNLDATSLSAQLVAGFNGATSLTTLYNDDFDVDVIPISTESAKIIEGMKANIAASGIPAMKAEKIAVAGKQADQSVGGLNAVGAAVSDNIAQISVTEDDAVNNGVYTVTYDADKLTLANVTTPAAHYSVSTEDGKATIAFADLTAIDPGTAVATFKFEAKNCLDTVVTVGTAEKNADLGLTISEDATVPGLGHDYAAVVTDATCTDGGYTTYTCSRCGDSYTGDETEALGHDWGEWTETKAATCSAKGEEKRECSRCDATETRETGFDASNHSFTNYIYNDNATCTEGGTKTAVCDYGCGTTDTVADADHPATGHAYEFVGFTWVGDDENGYTAATANFVCANDASHMESADAVITTASSDASCTAPGTVTYTAKATFEGQEYSDAKTVTGQALGHDYVAVVTDPTCTEGGYTTYTCSRCGDSYTGDETEALGHDYVAVVTDPTCTDGGYTTYTCSRCGDSYTGDETEALGHDYVAVVTDPTCTDGGYTTYTCSRCGDSYTGDETEALGHDYTVTYVWSDDNTAVTATAVCSRDDSHTVTETANSAVASETPATSAADGEIVYTVSFDNDLFEDQTKTVTLPKLDPAYEFVGFEWDDDGNAVAVFVDHNNNDARIEVIADVTSEETPATSSKEGSIVYTATVEFDGETYTDTKTVTLDKLDPDYVAEFVWNDDNSGATVIITDRNDPDAEPVIIDADVTSEETKPATYNEDGEITYTAVASYNGVTFTDTKTEVIPCEGSLLGGPCPYCGDYHNIKTLSGWWTELVHHILYIINRIFLWWSPVTL